jgi:uridine monophosphate synthetase
VGFLDKLRAAILRNDSLLCVGLDPHADLIPSSYSDVLAFNAAIVEATADLVCAYKPNYAFYEALGLEGLRTLHQTMKLVPPDIPVILDAKRGDIGSTAAAYARAAFEVWGADAVTVSPYLGGDSIRPFAEYRDRAVFVLCHTSNPSASEVQNWTQRDVPLFQHIVDLATHWVQPEQLGFVVGATYPSVLREVRSRAPDSWLLVPGIGAQGGDLKAALQAGLRPDGLGMIISSSRGILYSRNPREAARDLRRRINSARGSITVGTAEEDRGLSSDLASALFDIGSVRFGDFSLRSGKRSPVYIDLRLLASYPQVLDQAVRAYAQLLRGLRYARIAAVPYAGLPIGTAVSLALRVPLIYPRKEVKSHGTRRRVEGAYETGERVVLLDDLITDGGSKLEMIEALRGEGLTVEDLVVLIDREGGGAEQLQAAGCQVHAAFTLREMIRHLAISRRIDSAQVLEVEAYLNAHP